MLRLLLSAIVAGLFAAPAEAEEFIRPASVTPIGAHNCDGFYPEAARLAHIEGITTLSFHIDRNGAVSHVSLAKSSGNADLDEAAASCARTWRYAPTLKDGKPIEVAWSAEAEWRVQAAPPPPPRPLAVLTERDDNCFRYPFWAAHHKAEGTASVQLSLAADGHPSDISLTKPSGNSDLDTAALDCAHSMRFRIPDGMARSVTATATWSKLGNAKNVRWQFLGAHVSEAAEAMIELPAGIIQCLKGVAGRSEFSTGLGGNTLIWTRYAHGEMAEVSVLRSSGNGPLDRFAADCFKNQLPDSDRAHALRHVDVATFPIIWAHYLGL